MLTGKNYYAFGCSFTFGDGFPDCVEGLTPSTKTYPNKIADHYGLNLKNCSQAGSSPVGQFNRFHYKYHNMNKGDLVTFIWPASWRYNIIQEWDLEFIEDVNKTDVAYFESNFNPGLRQTPHPSFPESKYVETETWYSDYYTHLNSVINLSTYIHTVEKMCELKGIHCVQTILHEEDLILLKQLQKYDLPHNHHFKDTKFQTMGMNCYVRYEGITARVTRFTGLEPGYLPDRHFNEDTHIIWAHYFSRKIDRLSY